MDDFWGDIYGMDIDFDGDKDFDDFMIMDDLLSEDEKHAQNKSAGGPRKVSPNSYREELQKKEEDIKAKKC